MSDDSDDIDAALQARAAEGTPDSGVDDIDAALQARAKEAPTPKKDSASAESSNPFLRHAKSDLSDASAASDAVVTSILNAPHKAWEGTKDLFSRVTGQGPVTKTEGPAKLEDSSKETLAPGDVPTYLHGKASDAARALETASPTAFNILGHTADVLGDVGDIAQVAPLASPLIGGARRLAGSSLFDTAASEPAAMSTADAAQAAASKVASAQSGGAAGASVDTSKLTPETQRYLAEGHAAGQTPNAIALANHAEAESLPFPVRYLRGQALEDESIKTAEHNSKQEQPEVGKRYDEQDEALRDNLDTFHREASPTAVGNDITQNDSAVIDSLKRYDAPKKEAISDAYQAAKDANGGDLPMDGGSFVTKAEQNLKDSNRTRFLPSEVRGILDDIKANGGKMSFDEFESNRTILAEQARKAERAGDGTASYAVGQVRKALEDTPVTGASAEAKSLYDKARGLAKSRFQEMEADPAYDAAANDKTPVGELSDLAGKFNSKYVLNGNKASLQRLRGKLDQEGHEAMTSTGYGVLKDKAGLSKDKFIQNGYNTALDQMRRKGVAEELLGGADNVEDAAKLGRVARKAQTYSRGSAPNTSGTLTGALAREGVTAARGLAPSALNKGIDILGGHLAKRAAAKDLVETLRPGAGLFDK